MRMSNKPIAIVLSLDDFYSANHELAKLDKLNDYFDDFKVTMFAIPTCMPEDWVQMDVLTRSYMELAIHGYFHKFHECIDWDTTTAIKAIMDAEEPWTIPGFKAPFWIDSDGTLEACAKLGYWVALNPEEPPYGKVPPNLRTYYHDTDIANIPEEWEGDYLKLHGHIQNVCSNGLPECFDNILRLPKNTEFMFISDYMKETGGDSLPWAFRPDIPYDCYSLGMHSIFQGNMDIFTIEKLWDIAIEEGGPVLEIGGGVSSVIFGAATDTIIINSVLGYGFDMGDCVIKHQMKLMTIGDPTKPETVKKIPEGFKAKILYIDQGSSDILKMTYRNFVQNGGVIITRRDNTLQIERK